jgi:PAS domain S-box-containing protein
MQVQRSTSEPGRFDVVSLFQSRWLLAALVVVLSFMQPHTWPGHSTAIWMPVTGILFALGVWRGYAALLLILPVSFLAGVRSLIFDATPHWQLRLVEALCEGVCQAAALLAALWTFRNPGRGEADLRTPHSALSFLVFPGLVILGIALLRALLIWPFASEPYLLTREVTARWLAEGLGLVALAPPLLILATPWMTRNGLTGSNGWWDGHLPSLSERDLGENTLAARTVLAGRLRRLTRGDWVEIGLLVVGTTLLSVILTAALSPQNPGGWQLWGAPLLIVVWAGIRQGLQGAPLAAAAGTTAAVLLLDFLWPEMSGPLLLQGNLLAQCGAALLVAASVSWIRTSEQRYRQVVSQIPVILYSTRLTPSTGKEQPPVEILFVNPPCMTILGAPPEELLGDYEIWMRCVHPEDREIVRAAIAQLSRQNQPVVCEYRLAPKFGDINQPPSSRSPLPTPRNRWVRDVMVPHFDSEGRLEGWEGMASEITEQRLLADDLRRTTSMFHTLVANLPAGVFFVSAHSGRPILVNQRARQLLGQREDIAAGIEHLSTVYRLHRADGTPYPVEDLPVHQVLMRGAVSMCDDIVVHRPDGRRVPLISWAAPVDVGQSGRTDSVVWVLEDLTELRQAEAARRETEGRLRTVIESLAEALLVQDRQETVIDCNPAASALLGPLLQEGVSLAGGGWVREDGSPLPPEEHPIPRVLRTGVPVRNIIVGLPRSERVEQADNNAADSRPRPAALRTRWLLINALPLAPKPGTTPAGVVSTLLDVSDYIQAQQRIRDSEERYRGLVDTLPLMVLQFDRHLTLTLGNPAMTTISGYTLGEVNGLEDWSKLVHPDDLSAMLNAFQQALAGKNGRCECRYRARDGQERFCYMFMQPIWSQEETAPAHIAGQHLDNGQSNREVIGVTSLVLDLTRERRLEQELQRAQRLELVGRLSSSIAHDFNNLLAALLGLTELAELKAAEGEPVREELRQINQVGEQATQLTQQILAFCKQRPVPLRRVDVNRATQRITEILRTLLPRDVRLECALNEAPLLVQADEIQLQQVVMNLCLNARDAMPHGGLLAIRTRIEPGCPSNGRAGPWLCLSVEDTGEGMTPEIQGRIFEPFFSTKERGTGLGLAMVQQIIAGFGGNVHVQSEPGRGSRFDIWLPLACPETGTERHQVD